MRQLALEGDDEHEHRDDGSESEHDTLEHRDRARLERHRLQEEHRFEALAVDAREAEEDETEHLRGGEREPGAAEHASLPLVEALEVLLPVHPVVEPVEDQEEHPDRDERDDRLQLFPVDRERRQHGLGDHPRDGARDEREPDAHEHGPPEMALRADEARHERCEDENRLEPLAEDDDGGVRDHRDVGLWAAADLLLRAGERVVQRGAGRPDLLVGRMAAEKLDEAVVALRAVPEVALDLLEQRRRETAQSLLGTQLEDAVRLESRLLGLFPVAGRSSGLQAVERRGDDVEVGRLRRFLPLGRVQRADEREGLVGRCPDGVGVGDRIAARGVGESRSELVECGAQARGRARVGRGERGAEVDECRRRPVAKRDGLLDLELECHAPVLHAPAVLDGHEPKEAIELPGALHELRLRERSGPECGERRLDACERSVQRGGVACGGGEGFEGAGQRSLGPHAARRRVRGRDDVPVPEGESSHFGPRGREPCSSADEARESRAETRVVRVQQVTADGGAAARFGGTVPRASSSSAKVASAAAREKRVGGRNSRTSSQLRAEATSPDAAAAVASRSAARRIVVHTTARAVANSAWSSAETASSRVVESTLGDGEGLRAADEQLRDRTSCGREVRACRWLVTEDQRGVGVGEREVDVARELHGTGPVAVAAGASQGGSTLRLPRRPEPSLLRDLDLEPGCGLRHLAGDRRRARSALHGRASPPVPA